MTNRSNRLTRENLKVAKKQWSSETGTQHLQLLRSLTKRYGFAILLGDLLLLNGKWYVTHSGLLRLAERRNCVGINVRQVPNLCDPIAGRWVFKATVYKNRCLRGFVGHGDADPSNVSTLVRGSEMRIAETRAVSRALRKAYGIGLCSVEELGAVSASNIVPASSASAEGTAGPNGNGTCQPRLRDQLRLAIRRFHLDPNLVKSYAANFCGTESLSQASRESVQAFINHLNKAAEENRDALVCKLNSFAPRVEVQS